MEDAIMQALIDYKDDGDIMALGEFLEENGTTIVAELRLARLANTKLGETQ